jgi:hypothetical protein
MGYLSRPACLLLGLLCGSFSAVPLAAQTVDLASRTFWLGEVPPTMDEYFPFFAPRRIDWIEAIIEADPVLQDTVIHVEYVDVPLTQTIARTVADNGPLGPDRVAAQFDLPDYLVLGPDTVTSPSLYYLPRDADAGFAVTCSKNDDGQTLRFCLLLADYPPDDHIRLKARLYFPDNPGDRPDYFRAVAERLRDLVYCLDVTNDVVDVWAERPGLSGCAPEVTS